MGETTRKQTEVGEWYLCGTCPSTQMAVPIIACVAPPHPAIQGDAANSVFTVGPVRCVFCGEEHQFPLNQLIRRQAQPMPQEQH